MLARCGAVLQTMSSRAAWWPKPARCTTPIVENLMSNEVRALLSSYSSEVRKLAAQAQELIFSLVPDAHSVSLTWEKVRPGWKVIHFGLSDKLKDQFCGIGPQKTYVGIFF